MVEHQNTLVVGPGCCAPRVRYVMQASLDETRDAGQRRQSEPLCRETMHCGLVCQNPVETGEEVLRATGRPRLVQVVRGSQPAALRFPLGSATDAERIERCRPFLHSRLTTGRIPFTKSYGDAADTLRHANR